MVSKNTAIVQSNIYTLHAEALHLLPILQQRLERQWGNPRAKNLTSALFRIPYSLLFKKNVNREWNSK